MFYGIRPSKTQAPVWRHLALAVVLSMSIAGCDDDATGPENGGTTVVGTWIVTSFQAFGTDGIVEGMSMSATFSQVGTFILIVNDDMLGLCDGEGAINCNIGGGYSTTATQLTLEVDDEEGDDVVFAYAIQGTTMTWTGTIDSIPITVILQRQ